MKKGNNITWVMMYARNTGVTLVIPAIFAFPARVAAFAPSAELGDVRIAQQA